MNVFFPPFFFFLRFKNVCESQGLMNVFFIINIDIQMSGGMFLLFVCFNMLFFFITFSVKK